MIPGNNDKFMKPPIDIQTNVFKGEDDNHTIGSERILTKVAATDISTDFK